jgi:hypothetical protein
MATICNLGQHVFSRAEFPGPCPALEKVGDEYVCGLVAHPERFASKQRIMVKGLATLRWAALVLIGSGNGCDAGFIGEWRNKAYAEALDRQLREDTHVKAAKRAKRVWGAGY